MSLFILFKSISHYGNDFRLSINLLSQLTNLLHREREGGGGGGLKIEREKETPEHNSSNMSCLVNTHYTMLYVHSKQCSYQLPTSLAGLNHTYKASQKNSIQDVHVHPAAIAIPKALVH